MFFQEQPFQPLRIFGRQLEVAEEHFAHQDAVAREARGDCFGGLRAQLFAFGGKDFPRNVVRRQLAVDGGNNRGDDLLAHRLRQICVNRIQSLGVQTVTHRDGQADVQALARLHV